MKVERIKPLLKYMKERHRIYLRRQEGEPWPWTKDPILQEYSFCNVYRELDRVTIWIRENIREQFADHPYLWFMLCIARTINWPDTLDDLIHSAAWPSKRGPMGVWNPHEMVEVLQARQDDGGKVYTGAYMIRAESNPRTSWYNESKHFYIAHVVLGKVWEDRKWVGGAFKGESDWKGKSLQTLEGFTDWLRTKYGWGGFMAQEVMMDLRYTKWLNEAPDINTYAHAGPGARRGLNRLLGRPVKASWRDKDALAEMIQLLEMLQPHWPQGLGWSLLELHEVEMTLCELDKYLRVKNGEGRPRSKFIPPNQRKT